MSNFISECDGSSRSVEKAVFKLAEKYNFLKIIDVGESVLGKKILALEFGRTPDKVLYVGGVHGQEWLTSLLLLRFIAELADAYQNSGEMAGIDVRSALYGRSFILLPMLNPDGVDISLFGSAAAGKKLKQIYEITKGDYSSWNANANGIDINHNFDAGFNKLKKLEQAAGIFMPSPGKYGGIKPESEPETQSICRLCRQNDIRCLLAFHSQGEEIYWKYGEAEPKNSRLMANILSLSSGYRLAMPENTASHGGLKDWFITEFKKPAFTVEIGKGKNPLPIEQLDDIYERLREMLMLSAVL